MSGRGEGKKGRALTARPGYAVGYAKPPEATQFTKGQSGNPRGRPKGAKNKLPALNDERLKTIVIEEAYRTIPVRDGDRSVTVPMAQAVTRAMAVNAAKGQHRAKRLFSELLTNTERQNKALHDEWLKTAIDYKYDWDEELARRKSLGMTDLPEPILHPDDVIIDMNTGQVQITGPMTKEEKASLDEIRVRKRHWQEELAIQRADLEAETDETVRAGMLVEIQHYEKILETVCRLVPN